MSSHSEELVLDDEDDEDIEHLRSLFPDAGGDDDDDAAAGENACWLGKAREGKPQCEFISKAGDGSVRKE